MIFIIKDKFQVYMERTRLDPANPYSVLIGNIQNLYHECIRNWST